MQGDSGQPESGHLPVSVACPRVELADAPRRNPRIQCMAKGTSEDSPGTGNNGAPEIAIQVSDGRAQEEWNIFHGVKTKAYRHSDRGGLVRVPHVPKGCNNNDNAEELDGFFRKWRV